jgi:hypothetical protein
MIPKINKMQEACRLGMLLAFIILQCVRIDVDGVGKEVVI